MQGTATIFVSAISIGMLHGVEPGHGWPVAAAFALARPRPWVYGILAALILAVAHLASSFAVVAVYALADELLAISHFRWMHVITGGLLLLMALHQWRSDGHIHVVAHQHDAHPHVHEHNGAKGRGLLGLVGFAFALGFVHEEEFAIIALAAGKANPWIVMGVYAAAVAASLVLLTILSIALLHRFETALRRHHHKLPCISAVILAVMGLAYLFRLI